MISRRGFLTGTAAAVAVTGYMLAKPTIPPAEGWVKGELGTLYGMEVITDRQFAKKMMFGYLYGRQPLADTFTTLTGHTKHPPVDDMLDMILQVAYPKRQRDRHEPLMIVGGGDQPVDYYLWIALRPPMMGVPAILPTWPRGIVSAGQSLNQLVG